MECHFRPAKRKISEGSNPGEKDAKKRRLQIVIPKVPVTKEQLEKLRKLSGRPKEKPNDKDQKPDGSKLITTDQPVSSSEILKESPVAHRLTDLLGGVLSGQCHDNHSELSNSVDNKSNNTVQFKNPDAVRVRLFHPEEPTSVYDDSFPLVPDEDCFTVSCCPDVVERTCLQVKEDQNDSSLASYSPKADISAASGMKNENPGNEVTKQCDQAQLSTDNAVSDVQNFNVSNCSNVRENQPSSGNFPQETVDSDITVKSRVTQDAMSSSAGDNSIDYESGYNTLEVINSMLSELNEERNKREELEERLASMAENEKKQSEKIKELVNDLLLLSKAKAVTVSRGTQINMSLSLRRGRTVDRGTSPMEKRDPSPDLEMLNSSVGCQTDNFSLATSSCQTDEEVIPPKISMSAASQTDLCMPAILWPQQVAAAALQSALPTRTQSVARPSIQGTVPVQVQNALASNLSRVQYVPSGQLHHVPVGMLSQQAFSLQTAQQSQSSMQANSLTPARTLQHYPAPVSQTAGLSSAAYQSRALTSNHLMSPLAYSASKSTHLANSNQGPPTVAIQTSNHQALTSASMSFPLIDFNAISQRSVNPQSQITNQTLTSNLNVTQVNRSLPNVGRQQQPAQHMGAASITLQGTSAFQTRRNTATQKTLQNQVAQTASLRNPGSSLEHSSSSRAAHQQHIQSLATMLETPACSPLQTQGIDALLMSQTSQGASLNSSINIQSALSGANSQPSVVRPMATFENVQGNDNLRSRYQQGANFISSSSVQQPRSHPPPKNGQLHSQRNPASASLPINERRVLLNSPFGQTAVPGMAVQQSVARPSIGNTQLSAQRNQEILQNQHGTSQSSLLSQRGAVQGSVQQSLQSPTVSVSVTRLSNIYNNTLGMAGAVAITRNQETAQPSTQGLSLYDEVKRVYSELQQSLDEITLEKQKQKSASGITDNSSSVIGTGHMASNHPNKSNKTFVSSSSSSSSSSGTASEEPYSELACISSGESSNQLSPSVSFTTTGPLQQNQDESGQEQVDHLSSNKDPYRRRPRAPSGALEDTVQRLKSLQNKTSSSYADSGCSTLNSGSIDELFEGMSKEETSVELGQQEISSSDGRDVFLPENRSENEPLQELDSLKRVEETSSSCEAIEVFTEKWAPDTLVADAKEKEKARSTIGGTENSAVTDPDSVFIAPLTPSKTRGGWDADKDKNSDDLYMYLMSPVIPRISTPGGFRQRITRSDSSSDDTESGIATGSNVVNGDQGICAVGQNVDGDDATQDAEGSDSVGEMEETGKDDEMCDDANTQHRFQNVDNAGVGNPETEREQSAKEGDNSCEGTQTESTGSFAVSQQGDEDVQTGADPKQSMETNLADFEPVGDNVSDFPPTLLDGIESSNDAETPTGQETNTAPAQSTGDVVPHASVNIENCDYEFVRSAFQTERSTSDGDRGDEGMETEVEYSHSTPNAQQAVTSTRDADCLDNVMANEEAVKGGDSGNNFMRTGEDHMQNAAETQQSLTKLQSTEHKENSSPDDSEFEAGVDGTEESMEACNNSEKDLNTDTGTEQGIESQHSADNHDLDIKSDSVSSGTTAESVETLGRADNTKVVPEAAENVAEINHAARRTSDSVCSKESCE